MDKPYISCPKEKNKLPDYLECASISMRWMAKGSKKITMRMMVLQAHLNAKLGYDGGICWE